MITSHLKSKQTVCMHIDIEVIKSKRKKGNKGFHLYTYKFHFTNLSYKLFIRQAFQRKKRNKK